MVGPEQQVSMAMAMAMDLVAAQVAMDLTEVAAVYVALALDLTTEVAMDLTEVATQVAMDLNRRIQEERED